jgi:superfamily I DNA/RNA helicase
VNKHIIYIGQAGTGKTHELINHARELAADLLKAPHQKMLAITFMHGARRRLEQRMREDEQRGQTPIPRTVDTIDGFALSILNRWRLSLGYRRPITPTRDPAQGFKQDILGIRASFDEILATAASLLSTQTVGRTIGNTYPFVVLDEFQDCDGARLEFIKALSQHTRLLTAADDFQYLKDDPNCPALVWIRELETQGITEITPLLDFHRTDNTNILKAAKALRENKRRPATIPFFYAPRFNVAVWRIILPLWGKSVGHCTSTLLSPDERALKITTNSYQQQCRRKNMAMPCWHMVTAEKRSVDSLIQGLDKKLGNRGREPEEDPLVEQAYEEMKRFCHLRGACLESEGLLGFFAERVVHRLRAYGVSPSWRTAQTIHQAKNQEYDYVWIVWDPHSATRWSDLERRKLLYNAITRAKKDCVLIVIGDAKTAKRDPVFSLLGVPEPALKAPKKKSAASRAARRSR